MKRRGFFGAIAGAVAGVVAALRAKPTQTLRSVEEIEAACPFWDDHGIEWTVDYSGENHHYHFGDKWERHAIKMQNGGMIELRIRPADPLTLEIDWVKVVVPR